MSYCIDVPNTISIIGQWLYNWQTLISGILAVVAAGYTICELRKQINQQRDLYAESLQRRHEAFRVTLSLTLSQICSAIEQVMHELATISSQNNGAKDLLKGSKKELQEIFVISPEIITSLQGVIETSKNQNLVSLIYQIAVDIQVTVALIESLRTAGNYQVERIDRDRQIEHRLIDLAELYALTEALFDYARRKAVECPTSVSKSSGRAVLEKRLRFESLTFHHDLPEVQADEMLWCAPQHPKATK